MLTECPVKETGVWLDAYICFQYNIIHQLNAAHWIHPSQSFLSYGISVCLYWPKDVLEERDASNRTSMTMTEILRQMKADRKAM